MPESRKLRVFLCHSSNDKPAVRELYQRLKGEGWIDPWLDEEKLYPGQDWDLEIEKAVEAADAVIVFLSNNSVTKEGYIQRELRFVLRIADFKPEGTVFVIPVRLEDCPMPRRLSIWQYVDYFPKKRVDWAYKRLLDSLKVRAKKLGVSTVNQTEEINEKEKENQELEEAKRAAKIKEIELSAVLEQADEMINKEREEKAIIEKSLSGISVAGKKFIQNISLKQLGIGVIVLLVLLFLILGGNYAIKNLPTSNIPAATKSPSVPLFVSPTNKPTNTITATSTDIPLPTPTLGIGSTMISEKDDMVMVYVPAGEFQMGSASGEIDEKPVHTVYLDPFWIDQTEVTNGMYAKCVQVGRCGPPKWSGSSTRESYYGDVEFDEYPVINVNWYDANLYCEWAGRRLPTEAEWEKAAGWDEEKQYKYIYPWGNSINCTLANFGGQDDRCVGDTTKVGIYLNGKSFYGVLDMAGNVIEWVNDWYDENYYSISPSINPLGPDSGQNRVYRGGAWDHTWDALRVSWRTPSAPSFFIGNMGIRCARSEK